MTVTVRSTGAAGGDAVPVLGGEDGDRVLDGDEGDGDDVCGGPVGTEVVSSDAKGAGTAPPRTCSPARLMATHASVDVTATTATHASKAQTQRGTAALTRSPCHSGASDDLR